MAGVIKNVGIYAHVDAGKTTVTERLLYLCGKKRSPGRVDDGTAHTDFDPIERERGISVFSACTELEIRGSKVNLIDTPGHTDFAGETERSFMTVDGAVLVVSAVEGVESYTESLWDAMREAKKPCIVFINKADRAGSDVSSVISSLEKSFGAAFVPKTLVENEGEKECRAAANPEFDAMLLEALSDYDDTLAEYFLEEKAPPHEFVKATLARCMKEGKVVPTFCGSAIFGEGIGELSDGIAEYLPDADTAKEELSAVIYKIEHDKTMGKLSHVRMFGGELRSRENVELEAPGEMIIPGEDKRGGKISQIRKADGGKFYDVGTVGAGDTAVLCGLAQAKAGDRIGSYDLDEIRGLANPFLRVKATPDDPAKLTSLASALRELSDEEPYINSEWEKTEREITLSITGKIQLEVLSALLSERYGLSVSFSPPTVIYKETPIKIAEGYECYTMPKPCWAIVRLLIEPMPRGSGIAFDMGNIPSNQLFYKYQEHIRRSTFESAKQGIHGWEVTDFKATLIGGEHHTIHTHPLDFFLATPIAFLRGLTNCGSRLLEPTLRVRITAPENCSGKITSDILMMRGILDTPVITGGKCELEAVIPAAECSDYSSKLASVTSGKGAFRARFNGYADCPDGIGCDTPYRGVCPLDRAKWILFKRGAITENI